VDAPTPKVIAAAAEAARILRFMKGSVLVADISVLDAVPCRDRMII
jgi:hypothetical protein